MMKKLIALTLLAVLLAAPLSCLGESVTIEPLMEYKKAITPVENTDYVIITDKHSTLRAVFHTDGERLTDYLCAMRAAKIEPKRLRFAARREGKAPWLFLLEGKRGRNPGPAATSRRKGIS